MKRSQIPSRVLVLSLCIRVMLAGSYQTLLTQIARALRITLIWLVKHNFKTISLNCAAVSISVSSWTLVSMSYERYYAICHPLKSRESRQTWSHTKRMISAVWLASLIVMLPIALLSELQPIHGTSKYKSLGYLLCVLCFSGYCIAKINLSVQVKVAKVD